MIFLVPGTPSFVYSAQSSMGPEKVRVENRKKLKRARRAGLSLERIKTSGDSGAPMRRYCIMNSLAPVWLYCLENSGGLQGES